MSGPLLPGKSLLNMAEAMLGDEYKTSHPDLKEWADQTEKEVNEKASNHDFTDATTASGIRTPDPLDSNDKPSGFKRSDSKSVVIQVPPKRRKISNAYNIKEVVDDLYSCVSEEERQDAIYKALNSFDHEEQALHDAEIDAGADVALVKLLAFLEFKAGFRRPPMQADMVAITREISLACQALEMLYRASSEAVGRSFNRVGNDLLHILVILIDDEVKARMKTYSPESSPTSDSVSVEGQKSCGDEGNKASENDQSRSVTPPYYGSFGAGGGDRDLMLNKASKVLGHYARVGRATKPLAHFPGFLGSVLNLINMNPLDAVPWEARLSCLWTIANLACNSDNMAMMMCTPGLLNSLVNIGFRQIEPTDHIEQVMEILRARSISSRALLNLSWSPNNKVTMAENIALVRVLCQLAIQRRSPIPKSRTMQEVMTQTRRHAIGALRNLASAPRRSKIALAEYNNGKVLDVLTDAALNDSDSRVVELAYSCIHNLATHDTADMMVDSPALILALKNTLTDEQASNDPKSPKSHASSTLLVLERSITPEMPSYEKLRELLECINPTRNQESESDLSSEAVNTAEV